MKVKQPDFQEESKAAARGARAVAGIDEAGRGPWAGPVVAAAVVLPLADEQQWQGLLDSKALTRKRREHWAGLIKERARAWGVAQSSAREIDRLGIVPATKKAMLSAIAQLGGLCDHILLDVILFEKEDLALLPEQVELLRPLLEHQDKFIKGEQVSLCIAAASVLAKVSRDALMQEMDGKYPGYDFSSHKGYGTKDHWQALLRLGVCPIHRRSFKPVQRLLDIGL